MKPLALISGCGGLVFTPDETAFFREFNPWGLILFQRNCHSHQQIKALIGSFRALCGRRDASSACSHRFGASIHRRAFSVIYLKKTAKKGLRQPI